ncbi:unnamed protein product [Amoebophrya sp. A120]|nr:unnamed protein product [Amoebophrya sp. A120]|eukprot:GSA120T00018441001.1
MGKPGKKGSQKGVIKSNDKPRHGKGSSQPVGEVKMIEKRMDPSDGNGPFTHASFLKYHGEEKGQQLWDEALESSQMVEAKRKLKGPGKGKKQGGPESKKQENASASAAPKQGEQKKGGKNDGSKKNKGEGKAKPMKQPALEVAKSLSSMKKKGGKGGAEQSGPAPMKKEKRIDPSDGNGPFTKESFIKYHGEKKGLQLWNQAAPGSAGPNANNPFN